MPTRSQKGAINHRLSFYLRKGGFRKRLVYSISRIEGLTIHEQFENQPKIMFAKTIAKNTSKIKPKWIQQEGQYPEKWGKSYIHIYIYVWYSC